MLLTDYSMHENWYYPYLEEIFAGIIFDELNINESKYLTDTNDVALNFTVEFCKSIYNKLLESNNKNDIHIYLVALRIASYNVNAIIEGIYSKDESFFINRPVLFMLLFSRDNMFKYSTLRKLYEEWQYNN